MIHVLNFSGLPFIFSQIFCLESLSLNHLSILLYRECPEDYREAVSSLMFAAARFSELPELRKLRQIFQDRYGNSLELYVNQEVILYEPALNKITIS